MGCVKILFYNGFHEVLTIVYSYVFVYNFSVLFMFFTFLQIIMIGFKTLYSFNDLKFNAFLSTTMTLTLFSMAGVPPFMGFFTKLLLLIAAINSKFVFYFLFFFILLFLGLYFYLQNLRFVYSTGQRIKNAINYAMQLNMRTPIVYVYYSCISSFYLLFGFLFLDDTVLYFS